MTQKELSEREVVLGLVTALTNATRVLLTDAIAKSDDPERIKSLEAHLRSIEYFVENGGVTTWLMRK